MLLFGKKNSAKTELSVVVTNWLFQRILGLNASVKFPVHFTSYVKNVDENKVSESFKYSCAVSRGSNIAIYPGTSFLVGEGTIFANNLCIRTANHDAMDRDNYIVGNVTIGENCWLGHGVVILPDVSLGDNVTVGANSVVTKSFEDNCIIAGVPARIIKKIDGE